MGPYTVRSDTESTVIIGKDGVAIPVSLERVTMKLRVPDGVETLARLHHTMGQPYSDMQKSKRRK